ncbi:MAG: MFS transporter, partial [Dehalococcoidia bacterium]
MAKDAAGIEGRKGGIFYGWNIVGAGIAVNAIIFAAYLHGFSVFFLPIEREFGWTRSTISGALSLRQVESGFLSPVLGFVVDRVGPRRLIIVCALVTGTGLIALSRANGVVTFYLAFLVIAMGTGGLAHSLSWPIVISRWFRRKRGLATGIVTLGPLVAAPFVILNSHLEVAIGWRSVVLGYGILCLVVITAIGVFVVRDRPE